MMRPLNRCPHQRPALIQDFHDLLVCIVVAQLINRSDDLCRCRSEFPGGQRPGQLQRLRRTTVEPNVL
jgi:hypothetical protein